MQKDTALIEAISGEPALSAAQLSELKSFISERAPTCLHEAAGILKYRFVIPTFGKKAGTDDNSQLPERSSFGFYLQMYDWDSCFFSQSQSFLGITGLARDVVSNFLSLKKADGFIPRTVSPARVWDGNDLCKPFLCQALLHELKSEKFTRSLAPSFLQDLDCWLDYFRRTRMDKSGLFHWRNMLESGVDDNLSLISPLEAAKDENESDQGYPDGTILAADLCAYLICEYEAFSQLAIHCGEKELAHKYDDYAERLKEAMEERLWNDAFAVYCNLAPHSGKQIAIRSWTSLTPVFLGVAKPERMKRCIEENILNPQHFLRPFGLASAAVSETLYNQSRRGLYGRAIVSNWQGPVWVLPNVLAVRCLNRQNYVREAKHLALRVLRAMYGGLKSKGTLFENYDAETGAPLWAPDFMSWNALALELIDLLS